MRLMAKSGDARRRTPLARLQPISLVAALALCATAFAPRASAIVVVATDSQNHSLAPLDDPGWNNVADRGVYIGNRWMLTAGHVGAGETHFASIPDAFAVEGAEIRLQNPMGLDMYADLTMYRLSTDPDLPALSIADATPDVDAAVMLIGNGAAIEPDAVEQHWNRTGTAPNYTYEMVPSGGAFHGFVSTTGGKHWGTNLVEDDESVGHENDDDHTLPADAFPLDPNFGETVSFFTLFDKVPYTVSESEQVTDSEAQAQTGDSGSGVFVKVGGLWSLAGITFAVDIEDNQPGGTSSAFYKNRTFIADLAFYRNQILSISAVPELGSLALMSAAAFLAACGVARQRSRSARRRA
jgi:hypothetical protein